MDRKLESLKQFLDLKKMEGTRDSIRYADEVFLSHPAVEIMEIVVEYARLSILPSRSEAENDYLGEILELAVETEILDFWLNEVDHLLGHYLGHLDEDDRESYKDQQALLREYLSGDICSLPLKEPPVGIDPEHWKKLNELLQLQGSPGCSL